MIEAGEDSSRTYTPEEDARLAKQLAAVTFDVHRGTYAAAEINLRWFHEIHRRLFDGVRDHAGKSRARDFGSERLTFGPNRSCARGEVQQELSTIFSTIQRSLRSFLDHPDDPDFERGAIHLAVWSHAEVIKVHPFEDGNGRSSRLLMNSILVALGMRPVALDAVKYEYYEALNAYHRGRDLTVLKDLVIRLYVDTLP